MGTKSVIVGGGIAGITAALLLRQKGHHVTLIERANDLGGLLRSVYPFGQQYPFDYGTHLGRETGIEDLDELLYDGLDATYLPSTFAGSFHGKLFEGNGFLSDQGLTKEQREAGLSALIERIPLAEYEHLESQLSGQFGSVYATHLFEPIIRKHFNRAPNELVQNAHYLFGLSRLIAGSAEQTKNLKKQAKHDEVLAYHSHRDLVSAQRSLYPTTGGMGTWIKHLQAKLEAASVDLLTNCSITGIEQEGRSIVGIQTDQGRLDADHVVWCAPLFALLKSMDVALPAGGPHPRLTTTLQHLLIDADYGTDLYYFHCYEPSLKTFRVTLYDNFNPSSAPKRRLTVEHLLTDEQSTTLNREAFAQETCDELVQMGVIPSRAAVTDHRLELYPNGFPIPTHAFAEASAQFLEIAHASTDNLTLLGKSIGKIWFMNDVLVDAYRQIRAL